MAKSLLKQPETLCSEGPPTILDVEGKNEEKKERPKSKNHKPFTSKNIPKGQKITKNLKTFPSNTLALLNDVPPVPKRSLNLSYRTHNSHNCNNLQETTTTKIITHTKYKKTLMNLLVKQ